MMKSSRVIFLACLLCFITLQTIAQEKLVLNNLTKLELSERDGGLGGQRRRFEVVFENGVWKSYQLKDAATKSVIGTIEPEILASLLNIINIKDTNIYVRQFDLKHEEMVHTFDSLMRTDDFKSDKMESSQRKVFLRALNDQQILLRSLKRILKPFLLDDQSEYKIAIKMKSGESKEIVALSFANVYDLPWVLGNQKLHNPEISRIFAVLTGATYFNQFAKISLYRRLISEILRRDSVLLLQRLILELSSPV